MSFEGLELDLVVDLVKSMAVVIVVAYLFTRTKLYRQVLDDRLGRQGRLLLVLIFGAFSVWGTLSGVDVNGAIANTRDLGPALGGLIGGPVVGIGAGLIGGLQRLAMGGWTAVPSALGAVAAGAAGGAVFLLYRRRVAPVWAAMLLAVFTESVLMGLNLLMAKPFDQALQLVQDVIVPMILVNAAGMGLFVFIVRNEARERETMAQKERMEGELTVARDIQRSIVPTIFPPFPEREEFDLHAVLEPAREVGGDLYDFFLFDDDHLCLAIGDVSGKGVPASLFMAVTITLLRAAGARSADPAEVLAQVNAAALPRQRRRDVRDPVLRRVPGEHRRADLLDRRAPASERGARRRRRGDGAAHGGPGTRCRAGRELRQRRPCGSRWAMRWSSPATA